MKSAWEQLTQGQCNNDEELIKGKPKLTARQFKERVKASEARVTAKMAKVQALDKLGTAEARKAKKALSDSWDNRTTENVRGFWIAANA